MDRYDFDCVRVDDGSDHHDDNDDDRPQNQHQNGAFHNQYREHQAHLCYPDPQILAPGNVMIHDMDQLHQIHNVTRHFQQEGQLYEPGEGDEIEIIDPTEMGEGDYDITIPSNHTDVTSSTSRGEPGTTTTVVLSQCPDDYDGVEEFDPYAEYAVHDGAEYDDDIPELATYILKQHHDSVFTVSFDEPTQLIACGSGDDSAMLINFDIIKNPQRQFPDSPSDFDYTPVVYHFAREFDDSIIKVAFSPFYHGEQYFAIACMSGLILIYRMEDILRFKQLSDEERFTLSLPIYREFNCELDLDTFLWHPTLPIIGIGCTDGHLWTFDLDSEIATPYFGHNGGINSLFFTHDGNSLVSGSVDGQVLINNINPSLPDLRNVKHAQVDSQTSPIISGILHPDPRSNLICVGTASGGIHTISSIDTVHNGVKNLEAHGDSVEKLLFHHINSKTLYLFSASTDGSFKAWNFSESLQKRYTIELPYAITIFILHPKAPIVFIGSHDGIIRVHHAIDGRHLIDLTGHQDAILDLHSCGDYLFSSSDDKTVRIWDLTKHISNAILNPPTVFAPIPGQPLLQAGGFNIIGGNLQRRPTTRPPVRPPNKQ